MDMKQSNCKRAKAILSMMLFLPALANAHLISISATTPFPKSVLIATASQATYTVTNISSQADVTAINQSNFPAGSGLSISSTTCGSLLRPGQSCNIVVNLNAPASRTNIAAMLKVWAKPTADAVQMPIFIPVRSLPNITLEAITTSNDLPPLREPLFAVHDGKWLIVGGSTGPFHDFDAASALFKVYVYDPNTNTTTYASVASLPSDVKIQLASSNSQFLQDGDSLYIIGGFYQESSSQWDTLDTITSINVPGMINAVLNAETDLSPYVHYLSANTTPHAPPEFKVTGGQVGKIGKYFYVTFGQYCAGDNYCYPTQTYTNSITQFSTSPDLADLTIVKTVPRPGNNGWRRRDYDLVPLIIAGKEYQFAMGGPFTEDTALVWTDGIIYDEHLKVRDHFINQQANQYEDGFLAMFSAKDATSYIATFSGLSNLYWQSGSLMYDNTTPYGNILDLIRVADFTDVQEFANLTPITNTLVSGFPYEGLSAAFVPIDKYYDDRGMLLIDQLPADRPTLVGYLYGGLIASSSTVFSPPSASQASNGIFKVYVTPEGFGLNTWQDITNLHPGN